MYFKTEFIVRQQNSNILNFTACGSLHYYISFIDFIYILRFTFLTYVLISSHTTNYTFLRILRIQNF